MRISRFLASVMTTTVLLGGLAMESVAAGAEAAKTRYDVAAQPLGDALKELGRQSGLTVMVDSELVRGRMAPAVQGEFTADEALGRLLEASGLKAEYLDTHTIAVRAKPLARADGASAGAGRAEQAEAAIDRDKLEEVVVTATKRDTNLQQTAITLTVLGGTELERRSLISASDYLNSVPGVHLDSYGVGSNQLVIRGLGIILGQSPTAGAYLGDVPISDALDPSIVDVKLVDVARVEVLRGPQGTLYGSGAMGGAVRQIPMAPVINELSSHIKLGYADTSNSSDPSSNAVGIVNIPLVNDVLALRASAYHYRRAGVVDLVHSPSIDALSAAFDVPVVVKKDVGGHEYTGGRVAALFNPNDRLEMTLTLGYQKLKEDGRSEIAMSSNRYEYSVLATGREYRDQEFKFANLVIDYDLAWAKLTSSTSWTAIDTGQEFSHSRVIPSASTIPSQSEKTGVFQELRLATQLNGPFQVVGGVYYEDIEKDETQSITWVSPDLAALSAFWGTTDPDIFASNGRSTLKQLAFFGEASYEIVDGLKLTGGARWFDYKRNDFSEAFFGIAPGVDPARTETGDLPTKEDGQVYKVGLDYQLNPNTLLYTSWSQGFRLGQTMDNSAGFTLFRDVCDTNHDGTIDGASFPYEPKYTVLSDRLSNTELGGKFTLLGGRLTVNAAAYRIDWKDVPVTVSVAVNGLGCDATFNGGLARSQGVELETVFRATQGLQLSLSGSRADTEHRDNLSGQKGQQLPFAPKYNANLGVQYSFDVMGHGAFVRSDLSYVGKSATSLNAPDVVFTDSYRNLGMRVGVQFEHYSLEAYGTNLTNENPLVGVYNLNRGWRMEPRMVGLELSLDF